jgi:hypothetical protein
MVPKLVKTPLLNYKVMLIIKSVDLNQHINIDVTCMLI